MKSFVVFVLFCVASCYGATLTETELIDALLEGCVTHSQFSCIDFTNATFCTDFNHTLIAETCAFSIGVQTCSECTGEGFSWCQYSYLNQSCSAKETVYLNYTTKISFCLYGFDSCPTLSLEGVSEGDLVTECPGDCPVLTDTIITPASNLYLGDVFGDSVDVTGCNSITCLMGTSYFENVEVVEYVYGETVVTNNLNAWGDDHINLFGCSIYDGYGNFPGGQSTFNGINSSSSSGSTVEGCTFLSGSFICTGEDSSEIQSLDAFEITTNILAANTISSSSSSALQIQDCYMGSGAINCTEGPSTFHSIIFENEDITDYNPTPLSVHEESASFSFVMSGSWTYPHWVEMTASRTGNSVTLEWGISVADCSNANAIITAPVDTIPERFRPSSTALVFPELVENNSVVVLGFIQVQHDGFIGIGVLGGATEFFANTGTCGILYSSINYLAD